MKDNARARRIALPLLIRQTHAYVSVFLAPLVLFLSFTGCLQVYSLHEAHGDYTPPAVIEKLGVVHKDQVWRVKAKRPKASHGAAKAPPPPPEAGPPVKVVVLKAFFFAAGVSLILTTGLGLWMAVKYTRRPIVCWVLLALGVALPLLTFALPG